MVGRLAVKLSIAVVGAVLSPVGASTEPLITAGVVVVVLVASPTLPAGPGIVSAVAVEVGSLVVLVVLHPKPSSIVPASRNGERAFVVFIGTGLKRRTFLAYTVV
jgi:hypothetical protein